MYKSILWTFIGTFCGVALIQGVFGRIKIFAGHDVPPIVYSYVRTLLYADREAECLSDEMSTQGSVAVIAFATFDSPAAQPRAFLLGHFLGALIGVSITKLFELLHDEATFERHMWLAACLSCATVLLLMTITNTFHPPAGENTIFVHFTMTLLGFHF
jgi:CBS-domain-containing membrane protein